MQPKVRVVGPVKPMIGGRADRPRIAAVRVRRWGSLALTQSLCLRWVRRRRLRQRLSSWMIAPAHARVRRLAGGVAGISR
jgi:hypothetical protein